MQLKREKTQFCTQQLDTMLDLTMWSDRQQIDACTDSLNMIDSLNETAYECVNDVNAEACDPCTKHYNVFFDKYDVYVLQSILSLIQKVSEMDQVNLEMKYIPLNLK